MEVFWIVVGVVVVIFFLINQNKTKISDRTVIRQTDTIKTETGEVRIERTKTVEGTQTQYTKAPSVQAKPGDAYNNAVIEAYQKRMADNRQEKLITHQTPRVLLQESPVAKAPIAQENTKKFSSKKCPGCNRNLSFDRFRKSTKHDDGMTKWCVDCLSSPRDNGPYKTCPHCHRRRMKTSFYKNSNQPDGLTKWCKECMDHSK